MTASDNSRKTCIGLCVEVGRGVLCDVPVRGAAVASARAALVDGPIASGEAVIASVRQRDLLLNMARACRAAGEGLSWAGSEVTAYHGWQGPPAWDHPAPQTWDHPLAAR